MENKTAVDFLNSKLGSHTDLKLRRSQAVSLMEEYASLQCAEMKETIKTLRGLNEALCEDLRNKNEQCAEMKKELAGLKDVIGVYENLVIATQTYLQSISGRDIVHDQEAFNKVDAISNELNEKYKALNLVPHDTINKP